MATTKIKESLFFVSILGLILCIGAADYFTGYQFSFSVFYLVPISFFSIRPDSKRNVVIFIAVFSAVIWGISEVFSNETYSNIFLPIWNAGVRLVIFLTIGLLLHAFRKKNEDLEKTNQKLEDLYTEVKDRKDEILSINELLNIEKDRSEKLLANILPVKIIESLKGNQGLIADHYEECSVMFTDFKDFSLLAEEFSTDELVSELNHCFSTFDELIDKYDIEKIKTIGDSYMCVSGIPVSKENHAILAVFAAIELLDFISIYAEERKALNKKFFEIRIGIHTGHLIAGVVGKNKYSYDVWGETVNSASRFESASEPGKINISQSTYELVKDHFDCTYRGKISVKNMLETDMYFVDRIKPEYSADENGRHPNTQVYLYEKNSEEDSPEF